jgi:hypothetical protein
MAGYGGCTLPKAILVMAVRKSIMVISISKSCSKRGFPSAYVGVGGRLRRMDLPEGNSEDGVAQISHGRPRW